MNVTERVLAEVKKRENALLADAMKKMADGVNGNRIGSHVRVAHAPTVPPSTLARRANHNPYDPRGRA